MRTALTGNMAGDVFNVVIVNRQFGIKKKKFKYRFRHQYRKKKKTRYPSLLLSGFMFHHHQLQLRSSMYSRDAFDGVDSDIMVCV